MRDFTFYIIVPSKPEPIVALVNAGTDKKARAMAGQWLTLTDDAVRIEVHERGERLFVVDRGASAP